MRQPRTAGWGLSPRVRGSPRKTLAGATKEGSIPACAGEPPTRSSRSRAGRVYPRVCGGAPSPRRLTGKEGGLSPRVRGSRDAPPPLHVHGRSIPACAGEPGRKVNPITLLKVYPRVCGGSRRQGISRDSRYGSIPACAGEPKPHQPLGLNRRVYPRVCGGAVPAMLWNGHQKGLSPRVRGSPPPPPSSGQPPGSIPACAGEPRESLAAHIRDRVYPRVCGGA